VRDAYVVAFLRDTAGGVRRNVPQGQPAPRWRYLLLEAFRPPRHGKSGTAWVKPLQKALSLPRTGTTYSRPYGAYRPFASSAQSAVMARRHGRRRRRRTFLVIAFKSFVSICIMFLLFNFVLLVELVLVTPHTERLTSTVMLLGSADPVMCSRRCAPHRSVQFRTWTAGLCRQCSTNRFRNSVLKSIRGYF